MQVKLFNTDGMAATMKGPITNLFHFSPIFQAKF